MSCLHVCKRRQLQTACQRMTAGRVKTWKVVLWTWEGVSTECPGFLWVILSTDMNSKQVLWEPTFDLLCAAAYIYKHCPFIQYAFYMLGTIFVGVGLIFWFLGHIGFCWGFLRVFLFRFLFVCLFFWWGVVWFFSFKGKLSRKGSVIK